MTPLSQQDAVTAVFFSFYKIRTFKKSAIDSAGQWFVPTLPPFGRNRCCMKFRLVSNRWISI